MLLKSSWFKPDDMIMCTVDLKYKTLTSAFLYCYPSFREGTDIDKTVIIHEFEKYFQGDIEPKELSEQFELNIYIITYMNQEAMIHEKYDSNEYNANMFIYKEGESYSPIKFKRDNKTQSLLFREYDDSSLESIKKYEKLNVTKNDDTLQFIKWYNYYNPSNTYKYR